MKITKRQLKRIIKEEKARLIENREKAMHNERLAMNAADAALADIQEALGIKSGDLAAQWEGWDRLVEVLKQYINFEEEYGPDARGSQGDGMEPGQRYPGVS